MSLTDLARAIESQMTHPAGGLGDPLTESLLDQAQTAAEQPRDMREGWELEPASPPVTWPVLLVWALVIVWGLMLPGCGGGDADDEPDARVPTPIVHCEGRPEACR